MVKLSALVCVENDAPSLPGCLKGLGFCDEVVLVADRATPRVQEIARRYGARLVAGIFPLDGQRRAAGAEACAGDWILEVEADETVDSALAWEIRASLQMRPRGDWFDVPVANHVGGRFVQRGWGGPLGPARSARLYRRGAKRWSPRRLDSGVLSGAPAGALKGALRRDVAADTGGLVDRLNRLAALAAEDQVEAGRTLGVGSGLATGLGEFARSYLLARGWREGRTGLLLALLNGLHPVLAASRARDAVEDGRPSHAPQPLPPVLKLGAG
ncbi:glycosyltransferase family 2 protein [Phenylobacterium sp.]|uniref:glycosyltransferase family 2 protein n=1 Tax=Phenylobacterium sp. TaxID=1871053 RepID=UPI0035AF9960